MYFTDIIDQLEKGTWKINEKDQLIYEISESFLDIQFYPENVKMICGENSFDISYSEFSEISFKDEEVNTKNLENEEVSQTVTSIYFKNTKIKEVPSIIVDTVKEFCVELAELFEDDTECTPKFQVTSLIDEFSLNESDKYDADIYKILLMYKSRMEDAVNNDCLHENSKILMFVEENSGKFSDNFAKNVVNIGLGVLSGGLKGIASAAGNVAKAAAPRLAKGAIKNKTNSKGFMLLTDKNVILVKPDEVVDYDFNEASEIFSARQDENLVGIVDVYDDSENKVLDNVAQGKWNMFKSQLRKIRKESEQMAIGDSATMESEEDSFAEAEKKILRLKKMLENGLISQEDFDAKKTEILSTL